MKNNFLVIAIFINLAACASNRNVNPAQTMPAEAGENVKTEAAVRTTIDPQPAINQNINNINRHAGTVNSIPKN